MAQNKRNIKKPNPLDAKVSVPDYEKLEKQNQRIESRKSKFKM